MTARSIQDQSEFHDNCSRRTFLAGATATAAGLLVVKPRQVAAADANSKITLGLIGCGGRGNWIANLFQQHGGYQFVATSDYFSDRAKETAKRLGVAENRAFSGLSGYKRLLDVRPDAVVIETPPYFHAEQAIAGVDAGCHVYCAKPIAVDVPGCLTIAEAGRKGTEKHRVVLIDFQTRTSEFFKESIRRVHAGDIGKVVSGEAVYYGGQVWGGGYDPQNPESKIRAWGLDRILSGDIITEQFIHALDVATWVVDATPIKAYGACGKNGRQDAGTCNDHFGVIYSFPKDVLLTFTGTQFGQGGYDDIGCRVFGSQGMIDAHYFGIAHIIGQKSYKGGKHGNLFTDGVISNIATFHTAIGKGDCANTTVAPSVRSNLTTILGRLAAYKNAEVSWDEMIKSGEKLEFSTAGLKS
jgi:myo-inositol 2-dehydrogenase / D-chiro-inositol 1-dehydrogenase